MEGLIAGSGGLWGDITSGLTLLIGWGVFGVVAGALAALVVNRAIPTSRLKKMSALFRETQADTSVILALVEGAYTQKMISDLSTHDARGMIIRVDITDGLDLAVSTAM